MLKTNHCIPNTERLNYKKIEDRQEMISCYSVLLRRFPITVHTLLYYCSAEIKLLNQQNISVSMSLQKPEPKNCLSQSIQWLPFLSPRHGNAHRVLAALPPSPLRCAAASLAGISCGFPLSLILSFPLSFSHTGSLSWHVSACLSLGCHRLDGFNNRNIFAHVSEGSKSMIKVLAGVVPGENSMWASDGHLGTQSFHGLSSVCVDSWLLLFM